MRVCAASAALAGLSWKDALIKISGSGVFDPLLGRLSADEIQLCPQHPGALGEKSAEELRDQFKDSRLRLHANVALEGARFGKWDASTPRDAVFFKAWRKQAARISGLINASAYSWHAGSAKDGCSLAQALANTQALEDEMQIPVAIEGLYPSRREPWLLSSFKDWAWVNKQPNARFALDLSHWKICSQAEGKKELGLLAELMASPNCLEIHVSENGGEKDEHKALSIDQPPFWMEALESAIRAGSQAVVFSEGLAAGGRVQA